MPEDYGMLEERWYREGNAARYVARLPGTFVFQLRNGACIVLLPSELTAVEREAEFEQLLLQSWCKNYGSPDARERMRVFLHGADSLAD